MKSGCLSLSLSLDLPKLTTIICNKRQYSYSFSNTRFAVLEGHYHHHSQFIDIPSLTTVSLGHYKPNYYCSVTVHSTHNISHFTVDVQFPPGFDINETKCHIQ